MTRAQRCRYTKRCRCKALYVAAFLETGEYWKVCGECLPKLLDTLNRQFLRGSLHQPVNNMIVRWMPERVDSFCKKEGIVLRL